MQGRHFFQLVFLSAVWGASFPLIRVAAPVFGPLPVAWLRCVLAAAVLALVMRATRQVWPTRAQWPALAVLSLLTVVAPFVFFNWAGLVLPAGYSAVLNATVPLFGVVGGLLAGEERLTAGRLAGCGAGIAGVALLVGLGPVAPEARVLLAVLACIVASACYGFGAILMKRATRVHSPLTASAAVHLRARSCCWRRPPWRRQAPSSASKRCWRWPSSHVHLGRDVLDQHAADAGDPGERGDLLRLHDPDVRVAWGGFSGRAVHGGHAARVALVLVACGLVTGFNPLRLIASRRD